MISFPRSAKKSSRKWTIRSNFLYFYVFDSISTRCKVLHQHFLFTPDFLCCFIYQHCILFPRSGKSFNDLSCTHVVKAIKKGNSKMCLFSLIGKKGSKFFLAAVMFNFISPKWKIFHERIVISRIGQMFNELRYCQIVKNDRERSWNVCLNTKYKCITTNLRKLNGFIHFFTCLFSFSFARV